MNFTINQTLLNDNLQSPMNCQELLDSNYKMIESLNDSMLLKAKISILLIFFMFFMIEYFIIIKNKRELNKIEDKLLDIALFITPIFIGFMIAFVFLFIN